MSNKNLAILGIVAAVMVILAVVFSGLSDGPRTGSTGPAYLIQGLDAAAIGKIVVGSGDDVVTLRRRGRGFTVAEKSNYPADIKQINELIRNCADIKTAGAAQTSNPKNHADLEVTEETGKSVVKFFTPDPNSELITGVILGKNVEAGQGTYVRKLPQNDVYVTTESPWIRDQATDYIDQELIKVKREDVNSVTVTVGGESYTLKGGKNDVVSLENLPEGKKLKNTDARSVLTALTDLRFDDVAGSIGGLAFNEQYVCRLNDSTVYTLSIAQKEEKTYAICKAQFTGERPKEIKKDESPDELKKKEALLLAYDNAISFSTKHKGWIYEIPEWKAKNLTKKLSDLLEDIEKPKDPNAPKPADTGSPNAAIPKKVDAADAAKQAALKALESITPKSEPAEAEKPAPKPTVTEESAKPKPVEAEKPAEPKPAETQPKAPDVAKAEDPNAPKQ